MAQKRERKTVRRKQAAVKQKNKRLLSTLILVIACAAISVTMLYLKKGEEQEYKDKLAEKNRLERLIAEEEARTETISNYKAYVQTTSYIEEIAREVLGLVYKDEVIFKYENNDGE